MYVGMLFATHQRSLQILPISELLKIGGGNGGVTSSKTYFDGEF